jgi:hypothetical protein
MPELLPPELLLLLELVLCPELLPVPELLGRPDPLPLPELLPELEGPPLLDVDPVPTPELLEPPLLPPLPLELGGGFEPLPVPPELEPVAVAAAGEPEPELVSVGAVSGAPWVGPIACCRVPPNGPPSGLSVPPQAARVAPVTTAAIAALVKRKPMVRSAWRDEGYNGFNTTAVVGRA